MHGGASEAPSGIYGEKRMNSVIKGLLSGSIGDFIFPFFWQHGEDEAMLRKMMKVIDEANCRSVCIESRPHPDFCGDKWWKDMDIILDEARKRDMKVWILDDSHFPTGFANGKVKDAPLSLHRQSVVSSCKRFSGGEKDVKINLTKMFPPKIKSGNFAADSAVKFMSKGSPIFNDDRILSVTAVGPDGELTDIPVGNTGIVSWHKPAGKYKVYVTGLSRNYGTHREYMNMMSKESCRILIDEVYEKHYAHYKDDFGKTIAGFFSDEPELGNGSYITGGNMLGTVVDQPYSDELEKELIQRLGDNWKNRIVLLWDNDDPSEAAFVRLQYMDAVTKLVREAFSEQVGGWCRDHGVEYIGHVIEDNNSHTRTGMSLAHYFRGLNGQNMSGIDDIGGQVYPQGEELKMRSMFGNRDGEFYHFCLGNLAASAAAIEPLKNNNSMCEIFGNYGWSEGVRLEKYLAEHFMVRGINHFVPHAFTGLDFPDPDCPPHFYAQGHNPQYRHFGSIVKYMNRVCSLISGGHRESKVAVLYNAELEWMGKSQLIQKPLRKLYENQILADTIPLDVFFEPERYGTSIGETLKVNGQEYHALVVPNCEFINKAVKEKLDSLNIPVIFTDGLPRTYEDNKTAEYETVSLDGLVSRVKEIVKPTVEISPASRHVRVLEYTNGNRIMYLFNEDSSTYKGNIGIDLGSFYEYDAWNNKVYKLEGSEIVLEPNKGLILVEDTADEDLVSPRVVPEGEKTRLTEFERSICDATVYPDFSEKTHVTVPDDYSKTDKKFSGFIRYETDIEISGKEKAVLEITDAYEGVEVFVNGRSLGIQVVPEFIYDLSGYVTEGMNNLVIEVATTLERQMKARKKFDMASLALGMGGKPKDPTGLNGEVYLYTK
ncbi:MAG: hypothetical protein IJI78_01945 [Oscillospiraceae bacterium]|nr:hypothetical protein [Oscillospiraceae bacterium]